MPYDHLQQSYLLSYGLRISARDKVTGNVISWDCQLCEVFSREDGIGSNGRITNRVKYITGVSVPTTSEGTYKDSRILGGVST